MFRMFLVAYMAIPFLAAATFHGPASDLAHSLSCPCGQCEAGCGCCAGSDCTCADCVCGSCGCSGNTSLTSFAAEGEKPACCVGGACPSSLAMAEMACCSKDSGAGESSTLVASQGDCSCKACPVGCTDCEDCTDEECVCTNCPDDK